MGARRLSLLPLLVGGLCVLGCSGSSSGVTLDAGAGGDGSAIGDAGRHEGSAEAGDAIADVVADANIDKSATCVSTFGQAIGSVGFVRFDGTAVAIVAPGNKTCPAPNSTHLVLEMSFSGAVYRMVVDVDDVAAPGTIHSHTITHPLIGGAWKDGWHTVPLDYVKDLGQKSTDFPATSTANAVAAITSALGLGAHISVFATAMGENDSAHLIHRNLANEDGAIVLDVDGPLPTWLLFSFSDQTF